MKYTITESEGITFINIQGKIDIGDGDIKLREAIQTARDLSSRAVVVDMSKVSYMDSSGIGELVEQYGELERAKIPMCLVNLNSKIYDLMTLTRLVSVFPIFDSVIDATMSLGKEPLLSA